MLSCAEKGAGEILLGVMALQNLLGFAAVVTPFLPLRSVRRWRKATETVREKLNAIFFRSTLLLILLLGLLDPSAFLGSALSDLKEEVVQEYS